MNNPSSVFRIHLSFSSLLSAFTLNYTFLAKVTESTHCAISQDLLCTWTLLFCKAQLTHPLDQESPNPCRPRASSYLNMVWSAGRGLETPKLEDLKQAVHHSPKRGFAQYNERLCSCRSGDMIRVPISVVFLVHV